MLTRHVRQTILAALALATVAAAQPADGSFQVRYAANVECESVYQETEGGGVTTLVCEDSAVNFTNTGANNAQDICVNTYTFAPDEQLISCCSCRVTRNALWSLGVGRDLISNTLTPDHPRSVVIKLLATEPPASGTCNPASPGPNTQGLAAWGTTLHYLNPAITGGPTSAVFGGETPFTNSTLSAAERSVMTSFCGFIQANGSGYGICKACEFFRVGSPAPTVVFGPNNPAYNTGLGGDKK